VSNINFDILIYFLRGDPINISYSWDIYRVPQKQIPISKLIFDTLLRVEVQKPTKVHKSVKRPGNTFDLSTKCERVPAPQAHSKM
jgi:hypothetical protein